MRMQPSRLALLAGITLLELTPKVTQLSKDLVAEVKR
jgi:hypothetical protein